MSRPQVLDLGGERGGLGDGDPLSLTQIEQVDCVAGDLGSPVVLRLLPRDTAVLRPNLVITTSMTMTLVQLYYSALTLGKLSFTF